MSSILSGVVEAAIADLKTRSNNDKYLWNPVLWAEEVLGIFLWSAQKDIMMSVAINKKTAVKSSHSIGKDLPLTTPIPTPDGWSTMGELRPGDQVLGADGKPTRVVFKSEVMRTTNYVLTFSDGTQVIAGEDHQWNTIDMKSRKRAAKNHKITDWRNEWDYSKTLTTKMIVDTLYTEGGQNNHLIPLNKPLELPETVLQIDPYILGAWLGDGTSSAPYMTIGYDGQFLIDEFAHRGYALTELATQKYGYTFGSAFGYGVARGMLRSVGVLHNKHIPMNYLRASIAQRMDLLHGIMDTDGFVQQGGAGIDLANERLATDVAELIRSLGTSVNIRTGRMTVSGREVPGLRYRLAFSPKFNPFGESGHKAALFQSRRGNTIQSRTTGRTIVSAEVIPTVPSACITVDNADSLYLATEQMIPTHNTFTCAVLACWWISSRADCMVQSSAPTYNQVHSLLWEEIRKFHARAKLPGRVTQSDVWKRDYNGLEIQVGEGKKPADTNMHGFQGTHRPDGVLVILDEGCGINEMLYTASDAISTSPKDRVLTVGNPDDPNTEFGRIFLQPSGEWNLITVSAYDTPAWTKEDVPADILSHLPDPEWVESRKREWGEDSSRFRAKVLAEFPEQGADTFFSQSAIDAGYDTTLEDDLAIPCVLGVDVAGYGDNYSVIYANRGGRIRFYSRWSGGNAIESTDNIIDAAIKTGATEVRIDGSGFGSAIVDLVLSKSEGKFAVVKVLGGASPQDNMKHLNARAEQYDELRMGMLQGHLDLEREDVPLNRQMLAIKYKFTAKGAIQIESKTDMRSRGTASPDELDAVVYAAMNTDYLYEPTAKPGDSLHMSLEDIIGNLPDYFTALEW